MMTQARPSIRQAHKDLTRARIAEAARQCFYEKGVSETSFEDIATAAGVRRATVYLHFANKSAILADLLLHNLEEVRLIYERLCGLRAYNVASVKKWLESYVRALVRHRQAMRLFQIGMATDDTVRVMIENYRESVVRSLGRQFAAFAPEAGRAHAAAVLMVVKIDFVADAAAQPEPRLEVEAALDLVAEELSAMLAEPVTAS
ncbi:TetR/AcrR family transcriptional regulator [Sphingomonas sp.]|uniref:TetR/AcrR family transcriptional regulator n=1 Tax=Sphingomonas sp. TaxID=28214 RepID=UPI0017C8C956|nr:TetR family transcriptional regulator [Sphingomonas sp.]MBA4763139.1 TetR family transcriptional regulator [Sphingomonas sp.]